MTYVNIFIINVHLFSKLRNETKILKLKTTEHALPKATAPCQGPFFRIELLWAQVYSPRETRAYNRLEWNLSDKMHNILEEWILVVLVIFDSFGMKLFVVHYKKIKKIKIRKKALLVWVIEGNHYWMREKPFSILFVVRKEKHHHVAFSNL